jgi:ribosomal protein S12 methylthiotransferase
VKKNKINIVTLGCSKNVVDSEKLMRQLSAGGFEVIYDSDDTSAGTVIINTCGFIKDAKEESIDTILKFVRAKELRKIDNLYVMGCLAERYVNELRHEIPEVKKYFGVNNISDVLKELGLNLRDDLLTDRMLSGPSHYAYLKISEGCNRTCAFCAIPAIRGKYISRPVEELVREAQLLAQSGVRELILIAQDLSYYGLDLHKKQALTELVQELLKITEIQWIRLHYLYPANFPMELIGLMKNNPRICRYIDIPVQHISDRMLGLMRRSHNRRETINVLNSIRRELPDAVIRTTLITGHPGETEKDFEELKNFISDFKFDRLGVFAYSHEEDTYSFREYNDDITEEIKESRVAELMSIQQEISLAKNEEKTGKTFTVLIDRVEDDFYAGRTEYDSPEVDQEVLVPVSYDLKPGNFYNIKITETTDFDLYGIPE